MHIPRAKAISIFSLLLCALIWLGTLGCAKEVAEPFEPTDIQVVDIPMDNGSNVILKWRHFAASSAVKYDLYYSTSSDSIENDKLRKKLEPVTKTVQVIVPAVEDSAECDVCALGYYVVLQEQETQLPVAQVVKATPENEDSLAEIGEKIIRVEHELYPSDQSKKEICLAKGKYFRITPPEGELSGSQTILNDSKIVQGENGLTIEEGRGPVVLYMDVPEEEKNFVAKGDHIAQFDPDNPEYYLKYGKEVVAFVSENKRYTLSSAVAQVVIQELEPGKEYFYKVVSDNGQGDRNAADMASFTPIDEPPMQAMNTLAMLDSLDSSLLISWMGYNPGLAYFRDVDHYEIMHKTGNDEGEMQGESMGKFGADYDLYRFSGDFTEEDSFFVVTYDNAGQKSMSAAFGINLCSIDKPEPLKDFRVVDVENDDGSALSARWGIPTIDLEVSAMDIAPKYDKVDIPDGYYLIPSQNGDSLVYFENGDSTLPQNAKPIEKAEEWVPADKFEVSVRYRVYSNDGQDIRYAKLRMDDGNWEYDYNETGVFVFENLPAGEHKFEAILLSSSASELENPEASIVKTFNIEKPTTMRPDELPQVVQIWRGNEAVKVSDKEDSELVLEGTPNFDPNDKKTFELVGQVRISEKQHNDMWPDSLRDIGDYYYFARVLDENGNYKETAIEGPITPTSQWFHKSKAVVLILVILFVFFVSFFISAARKGKKFYLRPIAGISHLDEALGRATEMGRPILYVLGLSSIQDIATIAGLTILGRVAKKAAEFQTEVLVPCYNPLVLIAAQETVKGACMDAGHPEVYDDDNVFFAAGTQFSYAAAVSGLMVRRKTAANFYMGMFFAESLIFTETGSMSGAIQIAGTDAITQLPFFITTCDYTLLGEELYAASAYLSQDPMQVGTLKAQDTLKAIYMVVIVLGTIAMTSGLMWFVNLFKVRLEQ